MTNKQKATIERNLNSFIANFGKPKIVGNAKHGFYVYYPEDSDTFIQYCDSVDYLNGFLYGCVVGNLRMESKLNEGRKI